MCASRVRCLCAGGAARVPRRRERGARTHQRLHVRLLGLFRHSPLLRVVRRACGWVGGLARRRRSRAATPEARIVRRARTRCQTARSRPWRRRGTHRTPRRRRLSGASSDARVPACSSPGRRPPTSAGGADGSRPSRAGRSPAEAERARVWRGSDGCPSLQVLCAASDKRPPFEAKGSKQRRRIPLRRHGGGGASGAVGRQKRAARRASRSAAASVGRRQVAAT